MRKRYSFETVPAFASDTWIEGIGSLWGILYPVQCTVGLYSELLCFTENDTLKYINSTYNTCYITVDISYNQRNKDDIIIKGNDLEIRAYDNSAEYALKIYNVIGQEIINVIFPNSEIVHINDYRLKQGYYLCALYKNHNKIKLGRFIIIH